MIRIDGRKIQKEIRDSLHERVQALKSKPTLTLFYVGENPVIEVFVHLKEKFGAAIGVAVEIVRIPESITTEELIEEIHAHSMSTGIVIQLPLPKHIDAEAVINSVPVEQDIDVLSKKSLALLEKGALPYLPGVVGAIKEIFDCEKVTLENKKIVLVGRGKLVGVPILLWLQSIQHSPLVLSRESEDFELQLQDADVIISGAGSPGLITPTMVKDGVILLDAGTSEEGGRMLGDIDPACESKAAIFTPVPGGIGPITIAILFRNLLIAAEHEHHLPNQQ